MVYPSNTKETKRTKQMDKLLTPEELEDLKRVFLYFSEIEKIKAMLPDLYPKENQSCLIPNQ